MSSRHPSTSAQWVRHLESVQVPVLRATRDALDGWRALPDRADANSLADTVLRDPLMTLRVLAHVSRKLGGRLATPVETVTAGLVLTGIEPFFRDFAGLPVLEEVLAAHPEALEGVLRAVQRAHRAARLAAAFAIHRQDEDVELLHQAALLDNFAGLLVWCEAPELALDMARLQQDDAALRSADVQQAVLGTSLRIVEQELMQAWDLPPELRRLTDPQHGGQPGPHSVQLAVRIARHSQNGWDNAALPDDYAELGDLLNLPPLGAQQLVFGVEGG